MNNDYADIELRALVKSITSSLPYCAPDALDGLLYDKLSPVFFSLHRAMRRIEELESMLTEDTGDSGEIPEGWEDNVIQ